MSSASDKSPHSGDENDSSGDSLDFSSSRFNPMKALYTEDINIPVPNAPVYDNIAIFTSRMKAGTLNMAADKIARDRAKRQEQELQKKEIAAKNVERFPEHQRPTKIGKPFVRGPNLLSRMERQIGPLARLKQCMDMCIKVKVITRNEKGIRGHCTGFLQAFDKQWNIAMSDVNEVWTRKIKKKIPALDTFESAQVPTQRVAVRVPVMVVKSGTRGFESCERHIPQLLMRGEHVVMIIILA